MSCCHIVTACFIRLEYIAVVNSCKVFTQLSGPIPAEENFPERGWEHKAVCEPETRRLL